MAVHLLIVKTSLRITNVKLMVTHQASEDNQSHYSLRTENASTKCGNAWNSRTILKISVWTKARLIDIKIILDLAPIASSNKIFNSKSKTNTLSLSEHLSLLHGWSCLLLCHEFIFNLWLVVKNAVDRNVVIMRFMLMGEPKGRCEKGHICSEEESSCSGKMKMKRNSNKAKWMLKKLWHFLLTKAQRGL